MLLGHPDFFCCLRMRRNIVFDLVCTDLVDEVLGERTRFGPVLHDHRRRGLREEFRVEIETFTERSLKAPTPRPLCRVGRRGFALALVLCHGGCAHLVPVDLEHEPNNVQRRKRR